MDKIDHEKNDKKNLKLGTIYLLLFVILIAGGIIAKRVYGHPEFMMAFHGPAAVFLIIGGLKITERQRRKFKSIKDL